jgi:hypothetical protein
MSKEILAKNNGVVNEQETALAPTSTSTIEERMRQISEEVDEAIWKWREYQRLLKEIKEEGDFVKVPFKVKKRDKTGKIVEEIVWKEIPTKQWINKLTRSFNLSSEIKSLEFVGEKKDVCLAVVRVSTRNGGQWVEDVGSCSLEEASRSPLLKQGWSAYRLAVTIAVTQARERATSALCAAGAVTFEEMYPEKTVGRPEAEEIEIIEEPQPVQPTPQPRPQPQPQQKTNSIHRPMTPEEKEEYWKRHAELVEAIIQAFGDEEKAIAYAEKKYGHIRRLWDLHNSHLETILEEISSLSAEQGEEIDLPKPREERLL